MSLYRFEAGSGKRLLALHGFGADHRLMTGCLEPIFDKRSAGPPVRRTYFDLPGMGRSPASPGIESSDHVLDALIAEIDELFPGETFLLAGESYGGYLARGLIRRRPELVEGLLLLCPVIHAEREKRDLPPARVLVRDEAFVNALDPRSSRDFRDAPIQTEETWNRYRDEVLAGMKLADKAFLRGLRPAGYGFSFDPEDLSVPFGKPVLILTGRQDHFVGYRDQWKILERYPRASFAVLDRAGHNLQFEQAALFEALVNEWLDRSDEAARGLPPAAPRP